MVDKSTVVQSLTRSRLFPSSQPASTRTPLSILDATVARFSSTSAVWIYDTLLSTEGPYAIEWWDGGVAVSLTYEREALERLLKDETLRRFA